jgi:hypothetical protein
MEQAGYNRAYLTLTSLYTVGYGTGGYYVAYPLCPLYSRQWSRLGIMELTLTGLYAVVYGAGWI